MQKQPAEEKLYRIQLISLKIIDTTENMEKKITDNQTHNLINNSNLSRNQHENSIDEERTGNILMKFGKSIEHDDPVSKNDGPRNSAIDSGPGKAANRENRDADPDQSRIALIDSDLKNANYHENSDRMPHQFPDTKINIEINNLSEKNYDSKHLIKNHPRNHHIVPLQQLFNQYFHEVFSPESILYPLHHQFEIRTPEITPTHIIPGKKNIELYIKWFSEPHPFILKVIQKILLHMPDYEIQWIKDVDEIPNPELISKNLLEKINSSIINIIQTPQIHTITWNIKKSNALFEETIQTKNEPNQESTTKNIKSTITCTFTATIPLLHAIMQPTNDPHPNLTDIHTKKYSKYTLETIELFQANPQLAFQKLCNYILLNDEIITPPLPLLSKDPETKITAKQSEIYFSKNIHQSTLTLTFQIQHTIQKTQKIIEILLDMHIRHNITENQRQPDENIKFTIHSIKMEKSQIE